jgi:hypothetical protein
MNPRNDRWKTVRKWHLGKIALLWAWGGLLAIALLYLLQHYKDTLLEHILLGFTVLGALLFIPPALTIITWQWLGGKETDDTPASSVRTSPNPAEP